MAVDHIRYESWPRKPCAGSCTQVLVDAAKNGLPGEHHFYISFDTRAEGVRLSPRMLAQYPEEMTVVLQHQFWDLVVTDEGFEVGMSFGGIPERLAVPFAAVKGFFDPSVQFGLQFEEIGDAAAAAAQDAEASGAQGPRLPRALRRSTKASTPSWRRCPRLPMRRLAANPTRRDVGRRHRQALRAAVRSCGSTASARNKGRATADRNGSASRLLPSPVVCDAMATSEQP